MAFSFMQLNYLTFCEPEKAPRLIFSVASCEFLFHVWEPKNTRRAPSFTIYSNLLQSILFMGSNGANAW